MERMNSSLFLLLLSLTCCRLPTCMAFAAAAATTTANNGIAVIGCGVLGTSLCQQLLASPDFKGRPITGITRTTSHHEDILKAIGETDRFKVCTYDALHGQTFSDVVFCAPPSGSDDYPGAVEDAVLKVWAGRKEGGSFIFTSAGSVYEGGITVTEQSPVADSPRAQKLLKAEDACRSNGGAVCRLAGLYTLERGAHNFWLKSEKDVNGRADGIINLLHYDDAAGACMAAVKANAGDGAIFLVSDGNPLTRREICEVSLKHKMYADKNMPTFLGSDADPRGKVYDGSWTNRELNWKPKFESFATFMAQDSS